MEAIGGFAVFIMVLAVFAVIFIAKSVRVVPQQEAWVVCLLYTSDAADE